MLNSYFCIWENNSGLFISKDRSITAIQINKIINRYSKCHHHQQHIESQKSQAPDEVSFTASFTTIKSSI